MKDFDYIVQQGWMYTQLPNLTNSERAVYALIYSFSRDGMSRMRASARYIGEWIGCKERNAQYIVRRLEDLGLICHEVVRTNKGVCSEFWAVLPDEASPMPGIVKDRIEWAGGLRNTLRNPVTQPIALPPHAADCVTPKAVSRYSDDSNNNKYTRGKYRARLTQNDDHDDDLFSSMNESGLTPGKGLTLPFQEDAFAQAWRRLLEQPAWAAKGRATLQFILDELGEKCTLSEAIFCVNMAMRKEWSDMKPGEILARENPDNITQYLTDAERADLLQELADAGTIDEAQAAELEVLNKKLGRAQQ